jgi:predicted ATPase
MKANVTIITGAAGSGKSSILTDLTKNHSKIARFKGGSKELKKVTGFESSEAYVFEELTAKEIKALDLQAWTLVNIYITTQATIADLDCELTGFYVIEA